MHSKHMFKLIGKAIKAILGAQTILILAYVNVKNSDYDKELYNN